MSSTKYTVGTQFYYVRFGTVILNTICSIIKTEIKGAPIPRAIKIVYPSIHDNHYITLNENDEYNIYSASALESYLSSEKYYTVDYDKALEIARSQNEY